jgi:divalent metal cation (Fe/Co/Zn/Cd) transporter
LLWSAAATAINFAVARVLGQAGERFRSIALRADSRHLMTDVWTSAESSQVSPWSPGRVGFGGTH